MLASGDILTGAANVEASINHSSFAWIVSWFVDAGTCVKVFLSLFGDRLIRQALDRTGAKTEIKRLAYTQKSYAYVNVIL